MKRLFSILFLVLVSIGNAQDTSCKCCTENNDAFDFWIGDWEVFNPDDTIAGHNSIVQVQDNCIIQENWKSAKGKYSGTSNNFYNAKKGQWEQIWVDNQGGVLHLKGNRMGNQMILASDGETNDKGQTVKHRITWTKNDDGTVRQYWEVITNGTDISVAFDGLYKRKVE